MSLVITAVTPSFVVQVSDTRMTALTNQSVMSEELRKSLIVMGKRARFVIGWSGLASVNGYNTADWLFQSLFSLNAAQAEIEPIASNLTALATARFAQLVTADKRCHFVLGGWRTVSNVPQAFTCVIYNDHDVKNASEVRITWTPTKVAVPDFKYFISQFRPMARPYEVRIMGDFDTEKLDREIKGLKGLLRKGADQPIILTACRQIVLKAARQSRTINKNLISVEMDNKGNAYSSYHSEDGTEKMILPDFISPQGGVMCPTLGASLTGTEATIHIRGKVVRNCL